MALHFEQAQGDHLFEMAEFAAGMFFQKTIYNGIRAIERNVNVVVAGSPGVLQKSGGLLFIQRRQSVAQPIECFAQR